MPSGEDQAPLGERDPSAALQPPAGESPGACRAKTTPARRFDYDVLRVCCALMVLVYHFETAVRSAGALEGLGVRPRLAGISINLLGSGLDLGSLAVGLFFMLSGALAARTLARDDFSALGYVRHRLARLLPPFWIAWLLSCVWSLANGSAFFRVPAWRFVLTIFGLDGYVLSSTGAATFYNVGEWFYGALVIVTLLWPAVRACYRRFGRATIVAVIVVDVAASVALDRLGLGAWRSVPVCLSSFAFGAFLADGVRGGRPRATVALCLAAMVVGTVARPVPFSLRCQLVCAGVLALLELRARLAVRRGSPLPARSRARAVFEGLSGLTLYFFLFQHLAVLWVVAKALPLMGEGFGTFDYWGLAGLSALVALVAAMLAAALEGRVRGLAR